MLKLWFYSFHSLKIRVFIGAPKYAGFASQYNTTGAVFSCNIENEKCENFQLDFGDIRGKTKDHQLLGFSADIMPNQKYVVRTLTSLFFYSVQKIQIHTLF